MVILEYRPYKNIQNRTNLLSIYFILISFIGLFFLSILFLYSPTTSIYYNFQKTLFLLIFLGICLLGMFAAVYPEHCVYLLIYKKDLTNHRPHNRVKANYYKDMVMYEGHHPDCGKFSSHTFILRGKKYCAGCAGLFLGGFIVIIGTLIYYFGFFHSYLSGINASMSFWIGFFAVLFSLSLLIFINLKNNIVKFSSNFLLVLGSFLIFIGIDSIRGSISLEIYFLFLIIFWILTRIRISQHNHRLICLECDQTTCSSIM